MIMEIVFIILISLLILWLLMAFTAITNNNIYNIIFNRKERKAWEFAIHNIDKFEYDGDYILGKVFRWGYYVAVIWNNNTCSINISSPNRIECLGSPIDKVMSNKMRDLLLSKIK